jgi:hypothetical protein
LDLEIGMAAARRCALVGMAMASLSLLAPRCLRAQTDEIQVYNAEIAAPGVFNLTWHNNFTPDGLRDPAFPGGFAPNDAFNGVTEWAYGVAPWFEAGLYLPLYSITGGGSPLFNGFKLRTLFVLPNAAERRIFYGINFEFSWNAGHWDPHRYTSEIRPIIGWRSGPVDLIVNPILDNSWTSFNRLDFAPASRLAYNLSKTWALAAEEYDDFGELRGFLPGRQQAHQLFAVVDRAGAPMDIEIGAGFGLTSATDHLVLKLILSRDLNSIHRTGVSAHAPNTFN